MKYENFHIIDTQGRDVTGIVFWIAETHNIPVELMIEWASSHLETSDWFYDADKAGREITSACSSTDL